MSEVMWMMFKCGLVIAVGSAALATVRGMEEQLEAQKNRLTTEKTEPEEKPLIVGREYLYLNEGDWMRAVYMGKHDKLHEFWDLRTKQILRIGFTSGRTWKMSKSKEVRWIPDDCQSRLDCPECENIK